MTLTTEQMGKNIKAERTRRGWTQEELAERAGTSINTLANWERGTVKLPITGAVKVADCLGVSLDALFREGVPDAS